MLCRCRDFPTIRSYRVVLGVVSATATFTWAEVRATRPTAQATFSQLFDAHRSEGVWVSRLQRPGTMPVRPDPIRCARGV